AIFRWPGRIPAGISTPAFGTTMDLFVTCLRQARAAVPDDRRIDGVDLSPVLLENHPGREPQLFYWSFRELRAIRRGPWKLHFKTSDPDTGNWKRTVHDPPLLFNLHEDPSERHDVAARHPQLATTLLQALKDEQAAMKPGPLQW
ncbi:MAG: arylsulfatase, partial [Phycisphaerae bacterium]|nr:arylsulfatase [Phycisphaerae bacterium]